MGSAALVLGLCFGLFFSWDRSDLGEWIRELAALHDIEIEGKSYRYSVMDGLVLQEPTIRFSLPQGEAVLEASSVNVQLDRPRFFRNKFWCDSIGAHGPVLSLFFNTSSRTQDLPELDEPNYLVLKHNLPRCEPAEIALEDARLVIGEAPGEVPVLVLEGLKVLLKEPEFSPLMRNPLNALITSGELRAETMRRGARTYSGVNGRFDVADGRLEIENLSFESAYGRYLIESGTLDLAVAPPTLAAELSADFSDVRFLLWDLGIQLETPLPGRLEGKVSGPLSKLSATGRLTMAPEKVHFQQFPLIAKASRMVLSPPQNPEIRGPWIIPFTFVDSRIEIRGAKLEAPPFSCTLSGEIRPEHGVDLRSDILIPKAEVAGSFSPQTLADLQLATSPTRIRIPTRITGRLATPTIELRKGELTARTFSELEEYLRQRSIQETAKNFLP